MPPEQTPDAGTAVADAPSADQPSGDSKPAPEAPFEDKVKHAREHGLASLTEDEPSPDDSDEEAPDDQPEGDESGEGDGDVSEDTGAPEGDEEAEEDGDGETGESQEGDEGEADDEGLESELVTVEVPGRNDGETTEIQVSPEHEDTVRMLANDGMRRREFNRQMRAFQEGEKAQVEDFKARLEHDPVGVVLESSDPQTQYEIARSVMVANPQILETIANEIYDLQSDPNARARAQAELRADRLETNQRLTERESTRQAALARADAISEQVESMVPDGADPARVEQFFEDSLTHLQARVYRGEDIRPEDVPSILGSRLDLYFGAGEPGATSGSTGNGSASPTGSNQPSGARTAPVTDQQVSEARQTGEKLAEKAKRKRNTTTTPSGSGAVPNTSKQPPAGQTPKERIAWARKNGVSLF